MPSTKKFSVESLFSYAKRREQWAGIEADDFEEFMENFIKLLDKKRLKYQKLGSSRA